VTGGDWRSLLAEAAGSLGLAAVPLTVEGIPGGLPSTLPAGDTAVACVATALTAAAGLQCQRGGRRPRVRLEAVHVTAAVRSEAHVRVNGRGLGSGFAPLSRFWRAADGWVRTHGNYPWHQEALLRALGTADDPDAVGAAIAGRPAEATEAEVMAAGGVAAAVRTARQWRQHPHGHAVAGQPLVGSAVSEGAPPRRHEAAGLPAAGLRVLDLTRVIAGPVATRYLAALGADVLRVDPPHRPELPVHRYDGLPGKRSAVLDARTRDGLARLHQLLDGADILVHGYRPGSLAAFGLDPGALAERHPGLVAVSLSAWGAPGPWSGRRGFDSIVQAACGIAMAESPDGSRPGKLPCQLLDHGTGYLTAAAALEGVRRQSEAGGTHTFALSLAATAAWLLSQPSPAGPGAASGTGQQASEHLAILHSDAGPVTVVTPPGMLGSRPLAWPPRLTSYGQDPPAWTARAS
jgi:hypothetical protein